MLAEARDFCRAAAWFVAPHTHTHTHTRARARPFALTCSVVALNKMLMENRSIRSKVEMQHMYRQINRQTHDILIS